MVRQNTTPVLTVTGVGSLLQMEMSTTSLRTYLHLVSRLSASGASMTWTRSLEPARFGTSTCLLLDLQLILAQMDCRGWIMLCRLLKNTVSSWLSISSITGATMAELPPMSMHSVAQLHPGTPTLHPRHNTKPTLRPLWVDILLRLLSLHGNWRTNQGALDVMCK